MCKLPDSSIARIRSKDGKQVFGCGFLVDRKWVVSCAHVIKNALATKAEDKVENKAVYLDFPLVNSNRIIASNIAYSRPEEEIDICVLELEEAPTGTQVVNLAISNDLWDHSVRAFGFPAGRHDGVWTQGKMRSNVGTGWMQLDCEEESEYTVSKGFSGTPVWDNQLKAVIGIIVGTEGSSTIRSARIISSDSIVKTCSDFFNKSNLRINIVKVSIYPSNIIPEVNKKNVIIRRRELESIEKLLNENSVIAVTGLPGSGKSTLVRTYIERNISQDKFKTILWYHLDESTTITDMISRFFELTGSFSNIGKYDIIDQINIFSQELDKSPHFLVFDNFEAVIDPLTGKIIKPFFSDLIEKLIDLDYISRVILVCPQCPFSVHGRMPMYHSVRGLTEDEGVKLLEVRLRRNQEGSENELRRAVGSCNGHPLALVLLAQLINQRNRKLSNLLDEEDIWIGNGGIIADNILNKIYNENLSNNEQRLLQYVSIFRHPVTAEGIVKIANDHKWNISAVRSIAYKLILKQLLQNEGDNYWEDVLIKRYAASKSVNVSKHHKLASEYYLNCPVTIHPIKKKDVCYLIEAHHHACMAGLYDQAVNITFGKELGKNLALWGDYVTLLEVYSKMLPICNFSEISIPDSEKVQIKILGNLGDVNLHLGKVVEAINCYKGALEISKTKMYAGFEGRYLQKLGEAYCFMGNPTDGLDSCKKALTVLDNLDKTEEIKHSVIDTYDTFANISNYQGEYQQAVEFGKKALEISSSIEDKVSQIKALGIIGNSFSHLGFLKESMRIYEESLSISREINDKQGEEVNLGNIGACYYDLGNMQKAKMYYERALCISQDIGDKRNEAIWIKGIGSIYKDIGAAESAIKLYNEALRISREIVDKHTEAAILKSIGDLYSERKEFKVALGNYKKALSLNKEINHPGGTDSCTEAISSCKKLMNISEIK